MFDRLFSDLSEGLIRVYTPKPYINYGGAYIKVVLDLRD